MGPVKGKRRVALSKGRDCLAEGASNLEGRNILLKKNSQARRTVIIKNTSTEETNRKDEETGAISRGKNKSSSVLT